MTQQMPAPQPGQQYQATIVAQKPLASVGVAYVLWLLLGALGGHQFYLGKPGRGVLYLLTGGVLLIGVVIDLFTLPSQVRAVNAQRMVGLR